MARLNDKLFGKLDTSKIQSGKFFREGKFGDRKHLGLKGQLGHLKFAGRKGTTANLSGKNVKQFYDLISTRLKAKTRHYKTFLSRPDSRKIMAAAETMRKTDESFTREDKKDLKSIVDTIRVKQRQSILRGYPAESASDAPLVRETTNQLKNTSIGIKSGIQTVPNIAKKRGSKISPNIDVSVPENKTSHNAEDLGDLKDEMTKSDVEIPQATDATDLPID